MGSICSRFTGKQKTLSTEVQGRRYFMGLICSRFTGTQSELDMNPLIWQRLPADILETVLTKLPLSALRKFSRVSKSWKALIHSEVFAHRCQSVEPTVFYMSNDRNGAPFLVILSLTSASWHKFYPGFLLQDESVDLIGTSEGLLCYMMRKWSRTGRPLSGQEIHFAVHNPLTRKWRRLVVPYTFESLDGKLLLGGLAVDQDTGSYKVVLAIIAEHASRTTYIYDSGTKSWSVSAALSPAFTYRFQGTYPKVSKSICCDGELYWFVEEVYSNREYDPVVKILIKYSIDLDTWLTATYYRKLVNHHMGGCVHLTTFQKRPVIVNRLTASGFPEEFFGPGWNLTPFDVQDLARLIQTADYESDLSKLDLKRRLELERVPTHVSVAAALAECDTWFIAYYGYSLNMMCLKWEAGSVTLLPEGDLGGEDFDVDDMMRLLGTFAARLNAFV